jgi:hypothetical protein
MLMSLTALQTSLVDFDFFPVLKKLQNVISSPYELHFLKRIYYQNQNNEHYAMALVSFESENFEFLAIMDPFWISMVVYNLLKIL